MSDWEQGLSIGIKNIDDQHKGLFSTLAKLNTTIGAGNIDSSVRETMTYLEKYILIHFEEEEDLLRKIHFPELEKHSNQHSGFVLEFARKKNKMMDMKVIEESFVLEMQEWIGSWLRDHIMIEDKKIEKFIKENNIIL